MSAEELKAKIISLIDENTFQWRKAAFYSDPMVSEIMMRLYERWESSGRDGRPVDYASLEELEVLAEKAEKYAFMNDETARAITFSRMSGEADDRGENSLVAFMKAILGRRRKE